MRLSNLRKESHNGKSFLIVDLQCAFCNETSLWFSVDDKYGEWLTDDVYDAFMVEVIYPAMCYGEDVFIDGAVSKRIYKNLTEYIMPVIAVMYPSFSKISVNVKGFENAEKGSHGIIGTGFSGGVDSFSTIIDRFEKEEDCEYKINTLFFFNVGQYPGKAHDERLSHALQHYHNSIVFAKEVNIPYLFMDSNMFDALYQPRWEYDAGPMCRISSILVFQRALTRYYVSGSNHYLQQNSSIEKHLDDVTDEFIYNMLSPKGMEIILDGNQYFRSEKLENIAEYEYVTRHLNVCIDSDINVQVSKNCSVCNKCMRTLIVLEALGKLEAFSKVFDIEKYRRNAFINKCRLSLDNGKGVYSTENVRFAKAHGIMIPSKPVAWLCLMSYRILKRLKLR